MKRIFPQAAALLLARALTAFGLFQTLSGKCSGLCYAAFSQDILLA